jgi:rhamnogalacturonyl hydrolase YesR
VKISSSFERARRLHCDGCVNAIDAATRLANAKLERHPADAMRWTWGDGILLYGLVRLAEVVSAPGQARYLDATARFHRVWSTRAPRIDRPDACAPALSALALFRGHGRTVGLPVAARVARFVSRAPRNRIGCIDHLGTSALRTIVPSSIWVDTLAMVSAFSAQWAAHVGDARMLDFAAAQPGIYAATLQDPQEALFRHAYLVRFGRAVPRAPAFWLRGNGWALFAMVEMLEELPKDHPGSTEIAGLLARSAHALIRWQRDDGAWGTVINDDRSRAESSGTALAAYALARGARRGWLPPSMASAARRALAHVASRVEQSAAGVSLGEISAATNPMPGWGYPLVPHVRDASWGVGAFLLAAAEMAVAT